MTTTAVQTIPKRSQRRDKKIDRGLKGGACSTGNPVKSQAHKGGGSSRTETAQNSDKDPTSTKKEIKSALSGGETTLCFDQPVCGFEIEVRGDITAEKVKKRATSRGSFELQKKEQSMPTQIAKAADNRERKNEY